MQRAATEAVSVNKIAQNVAATKGKFDPIFTFLIQAHFHVHYLLKPLISVLLDGSVLCITANMCNESVYVL